MKKAEKTLIPVTEETYPANVIRAALIGQNPTETTKFKANVWDYSIPDVLTWLTQIPERDQRVIELRFRYGMTYEAVGNEFGVTRERIRQIEHRVLRFLCHKLNNMRVVPIADLKNAEVIIAQKDLDLATLKVRLTQLGEKVDLSEHDNKPLTADIEMLELSVRSYNCLKRKGLNTINDVINYDKAGRPWREVRNLGRKSLEEIRDRIKTYCGYEINMPTTAE